MLMVQNPQELSLSLTQARTAGSLSRVASLERKELSNWWWDVEEERGGGGREKEGRRKEGRRKEGRRKEGRRKEGRKRQEGREIGEDKGENEHGIRKRSWASSAVFLHYLTCDKLVLSPDPTLSWGKTVWWPSPIAWSSALSWDSVT